MTWVVAFQAQADAVQRDLNGADVLRAVLGTAPLPAHVLLFPSAEAALNPAAFSDPVRVAMSARRRIQHC